MGEDYTPFRKTQDFGPQAKASGAEAVIVFHAGAEAISFVKQCDSFGLKADLPLYGSAFLTSQLHVDAQGPAVTGVITALHHVPAIENPANAVLVAAFNARTGRVP